MASKAVKRRTLKRSFITPEGVDLRLELGSAGSRAAAFILDFLLMIAILVVLTFVLVDLGLASLRAGSGDNLLQVIGVIWLVGFFVLRNGWFSLFEMGSRGATPGKRLMGLRVVARDGARLTGSAVIARNAMREIEVFLPLSFLAAQSCRGHSGHLPHPLLAAVELHLPVLPAVQPRPPAARRPGRRDVGRPHRQGAALDRPRRRVVPAAAHLPARGARSSTAFTNCRRSRRCSATRTRTRSSPSRG